MYDIRFNSTFCKINAISIVDELTLYIQQTKQVPFCVQLQQRLLTSLSENHAIQIDKYSSYSDYGCYGDEISAVTKNDVQNAVNHIIEKLGYRKSQLAKAQQRVIKTVQSPLLGFDTSHFDFKYSQVEFVRRLCQLLLSDTALQTKVNESLCQVAIKQVNKFIRFYHHAYTPWIYVDTGFKRSTQPIFALALCESKRRIALPKTMQLLASNEQHSIVSELITQHYQYSQSLHDSKLGIWGEIQQYVFFSNDWKTTKPIVFNTLGEPIDNHPFTHSISTLQV